MDFQIKAFSENIPFSVETLQLIFAKNPLIVSLLLPCFWCTSQQTVWQQIKIFYLLSRGKACVSTAILRCELSENSQEKVNQLCRPGPIIILEGKRNS